MYRSVDTVEDTTTQVRWDCSADPLWVTVMEGFTDLRKEKAPHASLSWPVAYPGRLKLQEMMLGSVE